MTSKTELLSHERGPKIIFETFVKDIEDFVDCESQKCKENIAENLADSIQSIYSYESKRLGDWAKNYGVRVIGDKDGLKTHLTRDVLFLDCGVPLDQAPKEVLLYEDFDENILEINDFGNQKYLLSYKKKEGEKIFSFIFEQKENVFPVTEETKTLKKVSLWVENKLVKATIFNQGDKETKEAVVNLQQAPSNIIDSLDG